MGVLVWKEDGWVVEWVVVVVGGDEGGFDEEVGEGGVGVEEEWKRKFVEGV